MVTARWWPEVGGVETHARQIAKWLVERGIRVEVLCLDGDPERAFFEEQEFADEGVRVRRVAYRFQDHETLADLGENGRLEEIALRWADEGGLDLVHIHHLTGWGHGLVPALAQRAPVVLTLHDYWSICPRGQLWTSSGAVCSGPSVERCAPCLIDTWPHLFQADGGAGAPEQVAALALVAAEAFASASALLAPSEPALRTLTQAGVPADALRAFSLGVDCGGLAEEVERLRVVAPSREGRVVGVLGAVQPTKGVLELARAVLECGVADLCLHIHGPLPSFHGDTSYIEEVRALADAHAEIKLCGSYDPAELPAVLASLDAVAAPALWEEGFGLSVREAAAVGLPVLVSDAGGLPRLVEEDGAVGVVARRGDSNGIVEALRWMDATDSFGVVALADRPQLVGIAEMCEELVEVYAEVFAAQDSQASSSAEAEASQE
jgi:glycosyltransferase involved in cell wall biosynthesis